MISLLEGRGSRVEKPKGRALVLELTVAGCAPRIWRRLLVKETMWLARLHDSIQVAFDWFDYQTHVFSLEEMKLGNPVLQDGAVKIEDDRDITLVDLDLARRGRMGYDYNFGEGWRVDIRVEKVVPLEKGQAYPVCLDGERAGPPEDCGGVEAYHDMLACIKEPNTDLGREWIEWLGLRHDTERCDPAAINKALKKFGR